MRALSRCGRTLEALSFYEDKRQYLAREYGISHTNGLWRRATLVMPPVHWKWECGARALRLGVIGTRHQAVP